MAFDISNDAFWTGIVSARAAVPITDKARHRVHPATAIKFNRTAPPWTLQHLPTQVLTDRDQQLATREHVNVQSRNPMQMLSLDIAAVTLPAWPLSKYGTIFPFGAQFSTIFDGHVNVLYTANNVYAGPIWTYRHKFSPGQAKAQARHLIQNCPADH